MCLCLPGKLDIFAKRKFENAKYENQWLENACKFVAVGATHLQIYI